LSLRRLKKIREISADDFSVVVDAGCTLQQVQEAASAAGRFFPLSLSAEGSCQIGGNLSTNAGGINVLRYGTARSQVLGLEVVLPDGEIVHGLRSLRKDTAGYDLKQLFIGAEGTLGVITGACLKLEARPVNTQTAMLAIRSASDSVRLLGHLRDTLGTAVQAFELISQRAVEFVSRHIPDSRKPFADDSPWYVLTECTVSPDDLEQSLAVALEQGLIEDAIVAKNEQESTNLWRLRHSISESQKPEGVSLKHDVSVPVGRVGEFIERVETAVLVAAQEARPVIFGHVGDGNIHFNVSQPTGADAATFLSQSEILSEIIYDLVAAFGGSFSAEHGVGQARRRYLRRYRSPQELALMKVIKLAIDPLGIMNPGKVL